jgi:hypothetical protein
VTTKSTKRPLKAHQTLFGMVGCAHHTLSDRLVKGKEDQIILLLMVDEPVMTHQTPVSYGELSDALDEVAERFGCWPFPCNPSLRTTFLTPEVAYATVLYLIERSVGKFHTPTQLKQVMEPVLALVNKVSQWGTFADEKPLELKRLTARYLWMAEMRFINRPGLEPVVFDAQKLQVQAERSCQKIIDSRQFDGLPQLVQNIMAEQLARILADQQYERQIDRQLALKAADKEPQ